MHGAVISHLATTLIITTTITGTDITLVIITGVGIGIQFGDSTIHSGIHGFMLILAMDTMDHSIVHILRYITIITEQQGLEVGAITMGHEVQG